jgi:hypothetical protein
MEISNPIGRPTVVTSEALSKLEYAFTMGLSDRQACLYAGISTAALYRYQEDHPEFRERKEELKDATTMRAKLNVAGKILEGDIDQSNWWLERRAKDEFSTRSEHINANIDATAKLSDEERVKILSILNANPQPRDQQHPS